MAAERRMRCPNRNTVRHPTGRRLVVGASCPDPCRALVALSASSVSVQVSGVRCERPVSAACDVHASGVQCPGVRVWTFGVPRRCPRVPRRRLRCPRGGRPHGQEGLGLAALLHPRTARAVLGQRRRWEDMAVVMGGARAAGQGQPPDRPGTRRLSARIARRSRNSVRALCTPSAP